jgi:hypothetical protein
MAMAGMALVLTSADIIAFSLFSDALGRRGGGRR